MLAMQDSNVCQPSAISPLEQAIKKYEEQAHHLSNLLDKLDGRLSVVSSAKPATPCGTNEKPCQQFAPIVEVVNKITDGLKSVNSRINGMIERLDI